MENVTTHTDTYRGAVGTSWIWINEFFFHRRYRQISTTPVDKLSSESEYCSTTAGITFQYHTTRFDQSRSDRWNSPGTCRSFWTYSPPCFGKKKARFGRGRKTCFHPSRSAGRLLSRVKRRTWTTRLSRRWIGPTQGLIPEEGPWNDCLSRPG